MTQYNMLTFLYYNVLTIALIIKICFTLLNTSIDSDERHLTHTRVIL